jgi:hypothetical protein
MDKDTVQRNWESYKAARWALGSAAIRYVNALEDGDEDAPEARLEFLKARARATEAWSAWRHSGGSDEHQKGFLA